MERGHGDLFIDDRRVMQQQMFTPLQLPELFDALEGFGIRLVRKPVMVYTSQGIRSAHVQVFRMLENQLGRKPSEAGQDAVEAPGQPKEEGDAGGTPDGKGKFPEVERAVEEALDLLKYDGDVDDSLCEMRGRWATRPRRCTTGGSTASSNSMPASRTRRGWRRSDRS